MRSQYHLDINYGTLDIIHLRIGFHCVAQCIFGEIVISPLVGIISGIYDATPRQCSTAIQAVGTIFWEGIVRGDWIVDAILECHEIARARTRQKAVGLHQFCIL